MCIWLWLRRFPRAAAALTAAVLLSSCSPVGPDFLHPAAPDVDRYTPEKLTPRTSSTDAPNGQAQRFVQGRDIPQEWWRMFKSRALNALIERSLRNNPTRDRIGTWEISCLAAVVTCCMSTAVRIGKARSRSRPAILRAWPLSGGQRIPAAPSARNTAKG